MNKKHILFDLDGTLSNPKTGITRSVQYALESFGIIAPDADTLVKFIGPPLRDSFRVFYGFDDTNIEQAVSKYREYFTETGIYENTMYDGIPEMLKSLKAAGRTLVLATSKAAVYAERILEHFGIEGYFDFVSGSELDGTRSKKAEVVGYALERCGIDSVETAVMVGDREHDINGAKAHGMNSIGVLYGYGDRRELTEAGATYIVRNVGELSALLRGFDKK